MSSIYVRQTSVCPFVTLTPNHPTDKIYELVNNGMQDVNQIKDNLHAFVEREFSLGASKEELSAILDQNNRAYYPTSHDIRNHMVCVLKTNMIYSGEKFRLSKLYRVFIKVEENFQLDFGTATKILQSNLVIKLIRVLILH